MKISKERQLFDNKALVALIIPACDRTISGGSRRNGRFDHGGECRGSWQCPAYRLSTILSCCSSIFFGAGHRGSCCGRAVSWKKKRR